MHSFSYHLDWRANIRETLSVTSLSNILKFLRIAMQTKITSNYIWRKQVYCEAGSTILIFHSIISKFAPTWKQESTKYGPLVKKYGLGPWTLFYGPRIFTAQWKRRQLVCSIVGSLLHVTLPALSFASNMAGMDESKHCSFVMTPLSFLVGFFS